MLLLIPSPPPFWSVVCGAGGFSVWAAGAGRQAGPTLFNPAGYQTAVPEISDVAKPDIAPAEPGDGVDRKSVV